MADPNNIVLHDHRLVFMFICKAGNTSIKRAIADALDIPRVDLPENLSPHRRLDLHLPTPNKMDAWNLRKQKGYMVLTVVRHPMARLVSCWADKIENRLHQPFRRKYGGRIWQGMTFDQWVDFCASVPDGQADQHFRSMAWELTTYKGDFIPGEVLKIEDRNWWETMRQKVVAHCGLDIGAKRRENVTGKGNDWRRHYSENTMRIAAHRYSEDLKVFDYAC